MAHLHEHLYSVIRSMIVSSVAGLPKAHASAADSETAVMPMRGRSRWRAKYVVCMPIIDVTYGAQVAEEQLLQLAQTLPHAISLAVECPEEPYDGALQPGDVEVRFRPRGPYDVSGLDLVVEVRSKWFASRAEIRQERCDQLCDAIIEAAGTRSVGVYLSLPVAAWSQGE
jgi:hypothetical protein